MADGPRVGEDSFRHWDLVSANSLFFKQRLTGVISSVKMNTGTFGDFDWNILVPPDQSCHHLLRNSDGYHNDDWMVEAEVKSPELGALHLDEKFPPGEWVQIFGYWVEDSGHSHKTEIHPIIALMRGTLSSDRFKIYMCQDASGRFVTSNWPVDEVWQNSPSFDIPMITNTFMVVSGTPPLLATQNTTKLLRELATVDVTTKGMGDPDAFVLRMWNEGGTKVMAYQGPDGVAIEPRLFADGGYVRPVYLGEFERSQATLLKEQIVSRQLITDQDGKHKLLKVKLKVTLLDPPGEQLAYSRWLYEETSAFGTKSSNTVVIGGDPSADRAPPHTAEPTYYYGPHAIRNDTHFELAVMASTRPRSWFPGQRTNAGQLGLPSPEDRLFVQDRRTYAIEPSSVFLKIQAVFGNVPNVLAGCLTGYVLTLHQRLIAGVKGLKVGWRIQVLADANGGVPAGPATIDVPTDGSWRAGVDTGFGFMVKLDSADKSRLEIQFGFGVHVDAQGNSEGIWYPNNQSRLRVTGYVETELGENPEANSGELYANHPCFFRGSLHKLLLDLEKWAIAKTIIRKLRLPPFPWPEARLKRHWPPSGITPTGNPLRWHEALLKKEPQILRTLAKILDGRTASKSELKALVAAADLGSRLPSLRVRARRERPMLAISKERRPSGALARLMQKGEIRVLEGLAFKGKSSELAPGSADILDPWVDTLRATPELKALVAGHTSAGRDHASDVGLSRKRAQAVKRYFVSSGINARRLSAIGYGSADPRASNRSQTGRARNDRVELHFI